MASISMEAQGRNPADHLTDDIILEILSRLPVKSICRFKCVSRAWRNLISHPDHRKKLPQTLSGFFYYTYSRERFPESARHFTNITGRGPPLVPPSLSFLPSYRDITILDCCNGVLLCRRRTEGAIRYVVCNPATEEWTELPESGTTGIICTARLGFDLAVSPHFHVFEILETDLNPANGDVFVVGLEIYSSNTGEWAHRDSGWSDDATLNYDMSSVFLRASSICLHLNIKLFWLLIQRGRFGGPLQSLLGPIMDLLASLKGACTTSILFKDMISSCQCMFLRIMLRMSGSASTVS